MKIKQKSKTEMIATLKKLGYKKCKYNLFQANLRYADLRYADLRDADLRDADLRDADLRYANLSNADLRDADLRDADLRYANLSNANLSYDPSLFLRELEKSETGFIAYKSFGNIYQAPKRWQIKPGSIIKENVNFDILKECGCGVNVATLKWCKHNCGGQKIWKLEIPFTAQIIVPMYSDGKFRVNEAKLIGGLY